MMDFGTQVHMMPTLMQFYILLTKNLIYFLKVFVLERLCEGILVSVHYDDKFSGSHMQSVRQSKNMCVSVVEGAKGVEASAWPDVCDSGRPP